MAGDGASPVKPNRFVSTLVKYPCACACSTFLVAIILAAIGPAVLIGNEKTLFSSQGSYDIGHETALNQDAFAMAIEALHGDDEAQEEARLAEVIPQQTKQGHVLFVVLEGHGENVFTSTTLPKLKEIQDKVMNDPKFPEFCLRINSTDARCKQPRSPVNVFYGTQDPTLSAADKAVFDNANFETVLEKYIQMQFIHGPVPTLPVLVAAALPSVSSTYINDAAAMYLRLFMIAQGFNGQGPLQDISKTLELCKYMYRIPTLKSTIEFFFDKTFEADGESKYSRMLLSFGTPLAGYKNRDDRRAEQDKKLSDWFNDEFRSYLSEQAEGEGMDVLYFATPLVGAEFQLIILVDSLLAIGSFVFIFLFVWLQSGSMIVAAACVFEVVISLPISFTIYHVFLGFDYLSGLSAMVMYIAFAIGADDVFVFMDAFKQSAYEGPELLKDLDTRMRWTYHRAATAMLITSFTTMCAFVATAISPLVEVASFGIFAALVIMCDYLLVITFLPACVVLWHNYFGNKPNVCCACCQKSGCKTLCSKQKQTPTETSLAHYTDSDEVVPFKRRKAEEVFAGPVADFVLNPKIRAAIMVGFALWLIPVIIFSTQAEPATTPDQFLPSDHPFQRIFDILNEKFPATADDPNTAVYFVWGINTVNRDGVTLLIDPTNLGSVEYRSDFKLDTAGQTFMLDMCALAESQPFVARSADNPLLGQVVCPMRLFKDYALAQPGGVWPVPDADVDALFTKFVASPALASIDDDPLPFNATNADILPRYYGLKDGKLAYIAFSAEAKMRDRGFQSASQIKLEYDQFATLVAQVNDATPSSTKLGTCFQTTVGTVGDISKWVWMNTQELYVTSAVAGSIFGTCLAFVVLFAATRNIVVALTATVTIAGILASVLAFVTMLGWKLGTIESVSLTILAGFSVDYVVHLAHSYMDSKAPNRAGRTRDAFANMGVSVLSGMISSVGASLMLFLTTLVFFSKFGGFLCSTVVFSWIWANLFFMGVMATFGPEGGEKYLGFVCPKRSKRAEDSSGSDDEVRRVEMNSTTAAPVDGGV